MMIPLKSLNPAAIKWTSDLQKQMLLMVLMMIVNIERQTLDHVITSKASQVFINPLEVSVKFSSFNIITTT